MKKHKENKPYNPSGENSFKKDLIIMLPQNFTKFYILLLYFSYNWKQSGRKVNTVKFIYA